MLACCGDTWGIFFVFLEILATYLELIKRNLKTWVSSQNHGDKNRITIWTPQGMALTGCLINCIYMRIAVASVCGQFDRLRLDCIHGQETPSSPGSERQQAVMDFHGTTLKITTKKNNGVYQQVSSKNLA